MSRVEDGSLLKNLNLCDVAWGSVVLFNTHESSYVLVLERPAVEFGAPSPAIARVRKYGLSGKIEKEGVVVVNGSQKDGRLILDELMVGGKVELIPIDAGLRKFVSSRVTAIRVV